MKGIIVALTFIWVGLILGISFIEAPLKFQATGITLKLGLGIGELVFTALNRVETGCFLLILIAMILSKPGSRVWIFYSIPFAVLLVQTFILLPALNDRAERIINGEVLADSHFHFYYVAGEIIKITGLIIAGILFINERIR